MESSTKTYSTINLIKKGYFHYRALKQFKKLSEVKRKASTDPTKLVHDLLNLGPLYIKIGQILSTRPDLLPPEYIFALEQLQENVPPFPFLQAKQIIESEIGEKIESKFKEFEETPVASASLSQVYFAKLNSGEKVALKVRRPQVKQRINTDIRRIEDLLKMLTFFFPKKVRKANLINGFNEFKRYTMQELDFVHEGETMERFRLNFRDWPDIIIPKVYTDLSTEKLLTMEQVSGMRIKEAVKVFSKEEKEQLNTRLAEMELKMFISDGLFHADLHPGNIFFHENQIILLDFGMYGELHPSERDHFVLYWLAIVQKDVKRAFYHFKKQCQELPKANEDAFFETFQSLADEFYSNQLKDCSITRIYLSMIRAGFNFGYKFPSALLLHAKALTTAEALAFELAPYLRYEEITKPIIAKEFAALVLDKNNINKRLQRILPEFLLGQKEVPLDYRTESHAQPTDGLLLEAFGDQIWKLLKTWQADLGALRSLLEKPAREVLGDKMLNEEVDTILNRTWLEYKHLETDLPKQEGIGPTITMHLAGITLAMYQSLIKHGKLPEEATRLVYEVGWKLYSRMGEVPLFIAGMFTENPGKRMELATRVFRIFPFSSPDYKWEDVESDANSIAFNCTQCHVAEYFKKQNLGDLCYNTWCKLDFPLAQKWGGELERSGSIAGGAAKCDFKWKIIPDQN